MKSLWFSTMWGGVRYQDSECQPNNPQKSSKSLSYLAFDIICPKRFYRREALHDCSDLGFKEPSRFSEYRPLNCFQILGSEKVAIRVSILAGAAALKPNSKPAWKVPSPESVKTEVHPAWTGTMHLQNLARLSALRFWLEGPSHVVCFWGPNEDRKSKQNDMDWKVEETYPLTASETRTAMVQRLVDLPSPCRNFPYAVRIHQPYN